MSHSLDDNNDSKLSFAGRLKYFKPQWEKLTTDKEILETVAGLKITFEQKPVQMYEPKQNDGSLTEQHIIQQEIDRLLSLHVLQKVERENHDFISTIFIRPKKDGSHRLILNLKSLNKFVLYQHFKMETLTQALKLIRPNAYFGSIDLQDAYYTVPVHENFRKFLRFIWQNTVFEYLVAPNGLACVPRKFTKIMKPVFSMLRSHGHVVTGYLDDSLLIGNSAEECTSTLAAASNIISSLGFIIHTQKSQMDPTQCIVFLGFEINSVNMTVRLTSDKANKIKKSCQNLLKPNIHTIQEVAETVGLLVSSSAGVQHGPLFYRQLEIDKAVALKLNHGDFSKTCMLSDTSISDLQWWIDNIQTAYKLISQPPPTKTITTDASMLGWGCVMDGYDGSGGMWSAVEVTHHINLLELLAAFFALKAFRQHIIQSHVRLQIDNTTAVAAINHMGTSHSKRCNDLTKTIWLWCIDNHIWLSAVHIPGALNVQADQRSRNFSLNSEWQLDKRLFNSITELFHVKPEIDLFATRLNKQVEKYISHKPDPFAIAVDAFSVNWHNYKFYAFPPFSIILHTLYKIDQDSATGILIIPNWTTQSYFPVAMRQLIDFPIYIKPRKRNLILPQKLNEIHPLHRKLSLLACHLSGDVLKRQKFREKLRSLSCHHGDVQQNYNTMSTLSNGKFTVVEGILIQFQEI